MNNERVIVANTSDHADLESAIARIWACTLGIPTVEPEDNFLLLGGESLLAVQAACAVKERFGREISIRSIFTLSVSEVAAEIGANTPECELAINSNFGAAAFARDDR